MNTTQSQTASRPWIEISRESIIILAVCMLDLLSTVWLLSAGLATEANPLMAHLLDRSLALFCGVKMGTVFCLIALTEWYRKQHPIFVRSVMRFAIAGYLALYTVLLLKVNVS